MSTGDMRKAWPGEDDMFERVDLKAKTNQAILASLTLLCPILEPMASASLLVLAALACNLVCDPAWAERVKQQHLQLEPPSYVVDEWTEYLRSPDGLWIMNKAEARAKAYQVLANPYHPRLGEVKEMKAFIASPDGLWLSDRRQAFDKAIAVLSKPHPPNFLQEIMTMKAFIASPDGLWLSDRQRAFDKTMEVLARPHPPNFVESVKAKAGEFSSLGREQAFSKAVSLSYGGGGYNQGGYNHGGYNQGGYHHGGYNQGGYNGGSYGHHNRW
ncbi:unnamed protein product [Durusdinium trenchii]|uniref:Uncharacterized protein n=1 Tax=Durusdinium trenchii TaxID=1381693 RepID=A0ABP0I3E3_9DINO